MSNLNKIDVPVAVEHKTKLDLSCDHVTTMRFMRLQPVFYRHSIKKEHINIAANSVVRPAPIEVPTFGRLRQNLRAFFVPYRLIMPNWDSFYNDVIASNYSSSSLVAEVPQFSSIELCKLFFNTPNPLSISVSSSDPWDFHYDTGWYQLTTQGRMYLKILESLGYKLPIGDSKDTTPIIYNAFGLLALAKVYVDWYANSQYLNSIDVLTIERLLKYNDPTSKLVLTASDLDHILALFGIVVYDNEDYYTNAWDNPVSPNSGQYTSFTFQDPTASSGAYVATNSMGSPQMVAVGTNVGTTYIHEALKKLTDFQKRHALAGASSIDRVLAQYGVVTDSLKQARSIYVGSQNVDINIGSVMATADATNGSSSSSTGDFAGAGFGNGSKVWDFVPDEEGVFLVLSSIIPTGSLVQGYDRNNLHLDKFDFFVPEFDSLGVQAIEKGEVYVSDDVTFMNTGSVDQYKGVFGFSGRYGEYKRPKSFVTGDIRLPVFFNGGNSWHLMRLMDDASWSNNVANIVHSLSFTRGVDASQYMRMFQYNGVDRDPFFCFIHFDVAVHAPCKPLFETYEFDSDSKKVPTENGNKVN